jgi:SprT-like family
MTRKSKQRKGPAQSAPTRRAYSDLDRAYDFFNRRLFGGLLPRCLITLRARKGSYGFFAGERFGAAAGKEIVDEIALNPTRFKERGPKKVLSTLVHEMTHCWQDRFGKPTRGGYHNREWALKMRSIGLVPSSTGAPGGKETGQRMSHYIEPGGAFDRACDALLADGVTVAYVERWSDDEAKAVRKKKAASKTRFTCPSCDAHAWGKPDLHLVCGDCEERMLPADQELGAVVLRFPNQPAHAAG